MSAGAPGRAAALRLAFDRSFAEPLRQETMQRHDFLAVRVGAEPCAIRLAEVAGLFADRQITPVPSGSAGLVGIAAFRGTILPIYDLAGLLGREASAPLRWLVAAVEAPVCFAFEGFDRHVRITPEAVLPRREGVAVHGGECILLDDRVLPVIRMRAVLDTIAMPIPVPDIQGDPDHVR